MANIITARFVGKRSQDSGGEAPDYEVYDFTNVKDDNGKEYSDKWIKETKLMQAVSFQKGKDYKITLSEIDNFHKIMEYSSLPYPTEVAWDNEKVYLKGGNSIIQVDSNGNEKNLSIPITKMLGISNYDTAAMNKFGKGILSEDLLLKMNSQGKFFNITYSDTQDKRKGKVHSHGMSFKTEKGNYVLIQKETQKEIDSDIKNIMERYLNDSIRSYFKIVTEILTPKK